MNRLTLLILLLLPTISTGAENTPEAKYPTSSPIRTIPMPPVGQRWVVNDLFSDEFNGSTLYQNKWNDHHPSWAGREPGLFEPKQVSLEDGCLVLKGEKMAQDTVFKPYGNREARFNVSCAAVTSKTTSAHYGYYECRVKANKTTLSTTFWFSTRGVKRTEGLQPEGAEPGKFGQELDVLECIGRGGDFSGQFFKDGMNSNMHYWFTPDVGEKQNICAPESRISRKDGKLPSDDFNVYGCWWRDESSATFYLNNGEECSVDFVNKQSREPFRFTEPMGMNLVVEVYPFPWIELPTDEELADPMKNRSYYDWVRSYTLVGVDEAVASDEYRDIFKQRVHFVTKRSKLNASSGMLSFNVAYTTGLESMLEVLIYDSKGKAVSTEEYPAHIGYSYRNCEIKTKLKRGEKYHAVVYIRSTDKTKKPDQGDSFEFEAL